MGTASQLSLMGAASFEGRVADVFPSCMVRHSQLQTGSLSLIPPSSVL